jgi:hypothetical protein
MSRLNEAVNALAKEEGWGYTAGFLQSQLAEAVALLPKTKQKMFLAQFEHLVGQKVKVEVFNMMSGKPVMLAWNDVGSCVDPSTERYWSM